ncbi:hypothetical protein O1V64_00360 (plasmid) [Rouxiella badensis]|nr:hypothetical protein O1V64_00360 [Rouxiella badensis]
MNLIEFYQSEFGSDPYALMRAGEHDLRTAAALAGIDWSATSSQVILHNTGGPESRFSKYSRSKPQPLNVSDKSKVDFFSRLEEKDGLIAPFINFVRKGHDGGIWSGHSFLWELYKEERARIGTMVPNSVDEETRRQKQQEKREADKAHREALLTQAEDKKRRDNARRLANYQRTEEAFSTAPLENGSFPYAVDKQIADVFPHCNVRRVTLWDRGPNSEKDRVYGYPDVAH